MTRLFITSVEKNSVISLSRGAAASEVTDDDFDYDSEGYTVLVNWHDIINFNT